MNITNFIEWFITQFINIAAEIMNILDSITIAPNVTLLEFIIAIIIISAFAMIIITIPNVKSIEKVTRSRRKEKNDK